MRVIVSVTGICLLMGLLASTARIEAARIELDMSLEGETKDIAMSSTEFEDVDFSFMTSDFRYPEHKAGVFGTMKEWFGGRATSSEVKEDIVAAHTCARRGEADETYYASSFCYWMPEFTKHQRTAPSLLWRGGAYPAGKSLHRGVDGYSGVCVKMAICHNNARDDGGDVDKTSFLETVHLPSGCLKERDIERQCVAEYDSNSQDLKNEDERCHEVQRRYDTATSELATCKQQLRYLPGEIADLPRRIQKAENKVIRLEERYRYAKDRERSERSDMHRRCQRYQSKKGNLGFMNMLMGETSTERILRVSFSCSRPIMPRHDANGNGNHFDEMMRYNNNKAVYEACRECENAKRDLRRANSNVNNANRELRTAQRQPPELRNTLRKRQDELARWQSIEPSLTATKQAMDAEWLPQSRGCMKTYDDYKNGKASAVIACAPRYYENSCERACVEVQEVGCGVVEGSRQGDAAGLGGIQLQCAPPQPSWVLTPFTYGAQTNPAQQCENIQAHQTVQYAQRVLKSGWLWKKGRVGGWDKRFFALESGDAVRSAVLRYWEKDPSKIADAEERVQKGIILRDAKSVKAKTGNRYGFKNGEECFKIYHFYRDYRLCLSLDEGQESSTMEDERDEWLSLIQEAIIE